VFPSLAGNSVLRSDDATSAVHMVLAGGTVPATKIAPSTFIVAPYAWILTDQEEHGHGCNQQQSHGNAQAREITIIPADSVRCEFFLSCR
jgi:hypothetical protein